MVLESNTEYPHQINDLVVDPVIKPGGCDLLDNLLDLYMLLRPYSMTRIRDIFAPATIICTSQGRCYINEGSKCASFGILKISLSFLKFSLESDEKKPRLSFWDQSINANCDLSWTSHIPLNEKEQEAKEICKNTIDDEALLLIGLGRGWLGKGETKFSERRCYLLALGLIFN